MDEKEKDKRNVHTDHRKRVRERFLSSGLGGFPDHNVLEMLLFYAIPNGDTNDLAHRLIDTFGSLSAVIDAPYEELLRVKGIGEYSAVFINLLPQLFKRYSSDKLSEKLNFTDREELKSFVVSEFMGEADEKIKLLCFNGDGVFTNCSEISSGTKTKVLFDNRSLISAALRCNATHVVLAHNHPSGVAAPSERDIDSTAAAIRVFAEVDIKLIDHLIVAGENVFSMADNRKYCEMFN
ncbi:MAG: DNA repair protein RadC [Clostridiales bacterium]|nr:DNA repair protein RadC [Clostridiales bacterium]